MESWQKLLVVLWGVTSLVLFIKGFKESIYNKNAYGQSHFTYPWGIFVWGDAVVFGPFWTLTAFITSLLNDWILFLLTISVFWLIRSLGETIYWFNQQFSKVDRNPPKKNWLFKYFHNDSVWFVHQIAWQCVSVASTITSIFLSYLWIKSL